MSKITEDDIFKYKEIVPGVWQVKDEGLSYFTLIQGEKLAIVWDTGYGIRNTRSFVEKNISTPYIVLLSHGHPDHIMGSSRFEKAYLPEKDMDIVDYYTCSKYREKLICAMEDRIKNDSDACTLLMNAQLPVLYHVNPGDKYDMGGFHAEIVNLAGHSRGSIGLLLKEQRLLLSGDALNPYLWIFNEGACRLEEVLNNLKAAAELPFDRFLGGHSIEPLPKSYVYAHINNLKQFKFDESTLQTRVGCVTYTSVYDENGIHSEIVYDKNTCFIK